MELIQSDRGGMVYQPKVGLHMDVHRLTSSRCTLLLSSREYLTRRAFARPAWPVNAELGLVPATLNLCTTNALPSN